jgi:hypothetical protein
VHLLYYDLVLRLAEEELDRSLRDRLAHGGIAPVVGRSVRVGIGLALIRVGTRLSAGGNPLALRHVEPAGGPEPSGWARS